jgi:hypothetical protein
MFWNLQFYDMEIVFIFLTVIATFFFYGIYGLVYHKFIMHGIMWYFHKDHHQHEPGFFEKTTFFLILLFKLVMYNVGTYECILFCSLYRDWHCCLWSFLFFDARRFYTPTL